MANPSDFVPAYRAAVTSMINNVQTVILMTQMATDLSWGATTWLDAIPNGSDPNLTSTHFTDAVSAVATLSGNFATQRAILERLKP